ncbi:MAG: DNA polymerase III subunit gamma/tau [Phycisphaerales bacterium]|nr:DNA polymerase III subunit gamma/tau [Phycisphaerales bacterium]
MNTEQFVVSARKYRPQTFDTVVGQGSITTTLKNAIKNNHLAHAFLFHGPRGVGKTTCARILAKTINCLDIQPDGEACNKCQNCLTFNQGQSFNIYEMDAASNNSVDDIRHLIEQVRFAPQGGKYKVYIVDEIQMLSAAAFNAFLKTLEEPPPYAIFILATTEKHKILPTILSRCQIFDFKRITIQDITEHLKQITQKEQVTIDQSSLQLIAEKSEGCMRDALSIFDKIITFSNGLPITYTETLDHLNILDDDYFFRFITALLAKDLSTIFQLYDTIYQKGFEGDIVLTEFSEFIRNLLICKHNMPPHLLNVLEHAQERYKLLAQQLDNSFLISALHILNEAEFNYKTAKNKKLHIEFTLIKLNYLNDAILITQNNQTNIVQQKLAHTTPIAIQINPVLNFLPNNNLQNKTTGYDTTPQRDNIPQPTIQTFTIIKDKEKTPPPIETNGTVSVKTIPPKKDLLSHLKETIHAVKIEAVSNPLPLDDESLKQAWQLFLTKEHYSLTIQNMLKRALPSLESTDHVIIIKVNSNIDKVSIEKIKVDILNHLQTYFRNKLITIKIILEDIAISAHKQNIPTQPSRSYIERQNIIFTKYPLAKELISSLKMTIE